MDPVRDNGALRLFRYRVKMILRASNKTRVIPAKAGIHSLDPRLKHSGMTVLLGALNIVQPFREIYGNVFSVSYL